MSSQPPENTQHRIGKLTGKTVGWYHDADDRSNRHCLYCGRDVTKASSISWNKEHLIGRSFVPTGTMGVTTFNFIFRACEECNARKAVAQRHLSSVTLINGQDS